MGKTRKDTARQATYRIAITVSLNPDGTYEINSDGSHIPEQWLADELCAKRGFCGEELASIMRQLQEHGRAEIIL